MSMFRSFLIVGLLITAMGSSNAAGLIVNGSFEEASGIAPNSTLSPGATNLTGWTVIGSGNLIWCNSSTYCARPASDGVYSLDLTGLTNVAPYAGVQQEVATVIGTTYELTFSLAGRSDSFPVSVSATAGSTSASFQAGAALWETKSLVFAATDISTMISLIGESSGGQGLIIQLDNVSVSAIPELHTSSMLVTGLAALVALRRRRRTDPSKI